MGSMGAVILEIQELYMGGKSVEAIMKQTKTPRSFVEDSIKDLIESYQDDYPERPEIDFSRY